MTPVSTPGAMSGRLTVTNTQAGGAPSVRAAVSSRRSIPSMESRIARTMSGKETTAEATAAPCQVKARAMPNQSSSQAPSGPRLPSSSNSTKPTTTGGSTSGRWTRPLSSSRPGKR